MKHGSESRLYSAALRFTGFAYVGGIPAYVRFYDTHLGLHIGLG